MAKKGEFKYDAVVLHSEEEWENAESFCKHVRNIFVGGRSVNVVTMEAFSIPGKQIITIVNEAMEQARFIFLSEQYYYEHNMGNYSGNVAIFCKIPDKFVKIIIEGKPYSMKDGSGKPVLESFHGIRLGGKWEIPKPVLYKLQKLFETQSLECSLVDKTESLSLNEQVMGLPEGGSASNLYVRNPSMLSTNSLQSLDSVDETERKCPVESLSREGSDTSTTRVENSEATTLSGDNSLNLTSFSSDLAEDMAEGAGTPVMEPEAVVPDCQIQSIPAPKPDDQTQSIGFQPPNREPQEHIPCPNAQIPSPKAPNPGFTAQSSSSQTPDSQPPKQGSQSLDPDPSGLTPSSLAQGPQVAETLLVAASSSGGDVTKSAPRNRWTTGSGFATLRGLQGLSGSTTPSRTSPFGTAGRSMVAGTSGTPVSPNPQDAESRRRLLASRAEKRQLEQKRDE